MEQLARPNLPEGLDSRTDNVPRSLMLQWKECARQTGRTLLEMIGTAPWRRALDQLFTVGGRRAAGTAAVPAAWHAGAAFGTAGLLETGRSTGAGAGEMTAAITAHGPFKAGAAFGPDIRGTFLTGRPAFALSFPFAIAFALAAGRHRRAEFLFADGAVAVFVESLQRRSGIGDFFSGKRPVLIGIQRGQQGRHGTARALGTTRTGTTRRIAAFRLGLDEHGTGREGESNED